MKPRLAHVTTLTILSCSALCAQPGDSAFSLASGSDVWQSVADGGGSVTWETAGANITASLTGGGGYGGIAAPLDPSLAANLVDIQLAVAPEGDGRLEVGFAHSPNAPPEGPAWIPDLAASRRQHLAARIAPPRAPTGLLYVHIGVRGPGRVRVSDLAIVPEESLEAFHASPPEAPLPPDWEPNGTLDAQQQQIGTDLQLTANVRGIRITLLPETSCALGSFAPAAVLVENQGTARKTLEISGEFPDGVAFDARAFDLPASALEEVTLRVQGLLPGSYSGRVNVVSAGESISVPLRVTVKRGYPAFGIRPGPDDRAHGRWQLREMIVRSTPTSTVDDLLAQVNSGLVDSPALPLIHFEGLPPSDVLRALVNALKGRIALYGPAWRPDRPFGGGDPAEEAERLLAACREVQSVVSTEDPDAAVLSPVFDHTASAEGSPEHSLLDACLRLKMGQYFSGLVVASRLHAAGGTVGESVGGRNLRNASLLWTRFEEACAHEPIEALLAKHGVRAPILTSGISCRPSVDERLDALKMARAMALAAYAGATGATFPETESDDTVGLRRAGGSWTATGVAVKALSRELAGAAPVLRSWDSQGVPGNLGDPIVILPFIREREAILVLWNNTSIRRPLTLTLRSIPYSQHSLTLSRDEPFLSRDYQPKFDFSNKARRARKPDVYIDIDPLQIKVLRYRLKVALPTWLESIEITQPKKGGPPHGRDRDDRPWWKKLQDWAEGIE